MPSQRGQESEEGAVPFGDGFWMIWKVGGGESSRVGIMAPPAPNATSVTGYITLECVTTVSRVL